MQNTTLPGKDCKVAPGAVRLSVKHNDCTKFRMIIPTDLRNMCSVALCQIKTLVP